MSDNMRWRYGDTDPVEAAVNAAEVIEIGDAVWQDTDDAKPAGEFTWTAGVIGATQDAFVAKFLGVSMQRHRAADAAASIRVATTGVFEFTCASTTFELGALVGMAKASGNALENQKVVAVTDDARAIGKVARRVAVAATTVLVEIVSTVQHGGVQTHTASAA